MKFKKWSKFAVILAVLALLPLLIGQQPLSDAQLRQIIADWLGYPVDQIQFEDLGAGGISWFAVVSASDPTITFADNWVQEYEVTLPDGMTYSVSIDRYSGIIYKASHFLTIEGLTIDDMLSSNQAIEIARQYLRRYYIWADTSDWVVTEITPEVENGRWTQLSPTISVTFEPPIQAPQLPEGIVFSNTAIGCSITMNAVDGSFVGFTARYSQVDIPMEPFITPEEAESIARQYLLGKGIQIEGEGHWASMALAPEVETMQARLVYNFSFLCPKGDDLYSTAWIGVDAHTGEVVYQETP